MKTIYIVHKNRKKFSVVKSLYDNLFSVFGNYINLKRVFLEDLEKDPSLSIRDGDLYMVLYQDRIYDLNNYVDSLNKVIVLNRTIQKRHLQDILSLPKGSAVLVVNDDNNSTLQLTTTLYQLGLTHISLIPYLTDSPANKEKDLNIIESSKQTAEKTYDDINIAITTDELECVPTHIKTIVNIGDRYIDSNTFISIVNKLNLEDEHIKKNMFMYFQSIVTTDLGEGKSYLSDYIKGEMLEKTVQNSDEMVLLLNHEGELIFSNRKTRETFDDAANISKHSIAEILEKLMNLELGKSYNEIDETSYFVNKISISILDQNIGYAIILQSESDIKQKEQNISARLLKKGLIANYTFTDIKYQSEIMKETVNQAKKVALTDFSVILTGESGTGKELFAQSIHNSSIRKFNPFVAINCAAIPENLLESELFGYEKGAFTGANNRGKIGLFEQANRGTIFLDEIGDMPLYLQARLLRVIQEQQIMKLGSDRVINIDVRIIAATNKNLDKMMQVGKFREDLYYRLSTLCINIPPLREREKDAVFIAKSLLDKNSIHLSDEQISSIENYSWPGNIRELLNTMWYLQTFDKLPKVVCPNYSITKTKNYKSEIQYNENHNLEHKKNIYRTVLKIIDSNSDDNHGIGRTNLLYCLNELLLDNSINIKSPVTHRISTVTKISDVKLRNMLTTMQNNGHITINKGRAGNIITEEGHIYLEKE